MIDNKTLTETRNGENVIPLRNAVCGIDMPYWKLSVKNENETFLSGEAADKLATFEKAVSEGRIIVLPCPIGTTLYQVQMQTMRDGKTKRFREIRKVKFTHNNFHRVVEGYGTKYFLTRKEAEEKAREICITD